MIIIRSFFHRIIDDLFRKELFLIKLVFFVKFSTFFIIYPYLTTHMRQLGINVEEAAVMSALTPFVAIIMPPVAGMIADRIGNFKVLMSLLSALAGGASLLLLTVPIGRVTVHYPDDVVLNLGCRDVGKFDFTMDQDNSCDAKTHAELDVTLQSCGYSCSMNKLNQSQMDAILDSRRYEIDLYDSKTQQNFTYSYLISGEVSEGVKIHRKNESLNPYNIKLNNLEYYKTVTRRVSKNVVFFPTNNPKIFDFVCNTNISGSSNNSNVCGLKTIQTQETKDKVLTTSNVSLKTLELSENDFSELQQRFRLVNIQWPGQPTVLTNCDTVQESSDVKVFLPNEQTLLSQNCTRTCLFTAPRKNLCQNLQSKIEYNPKLTFWSYLMVRVFIGSLGSTSYAMFEGAVIATLREQKADYGMQRIYASIGGMISSPLSGMLIDYASVGKGYTDFRPAFYLYAVLRFLTSFLTLFMDLEFKAPAAKVIKDVISVLKNIELLALLLACFVLGIAWGYMESFLFWFLEDLGASRSLMGITITVGGLVGIPLLVLSEPIIARIGHANVLFIGFIFFAARLTGYSLIYNPWLCLIFEAFESVTISLSLTAAVTYAAKLSTTSTDSSIQGLLGGIYYGVGKGLGSLIGGFLMKAFGTRRTFQIFAVATLVTGFCYFLFNLLYLSKRSQDKENDIDEKTSNEKTKSNGDTFTATIDLKEKMPRKSSITKCELPMNGVKVVGSEESEKQKPIESKPEDDNNLRRRRSNTPSVNLEV